MRTGEAEARNVTRMTSLPVRRRPMGLRFPPAWLTGPCQVPSVAGMATKTTVILVDDLTGEPADTTLRFGLDAREYELDLTEKNARELRELFGRYIPAARRISGRPRDTTAAAKPAFSGVDPAAVRAWAHSNGVAVSSRGRIKANIVAAFRAAGH